MFHPENRDTFVIDSERYCINEHNQLLRVRDSAVAFLCPRIHDSNLSLKQFANSDLEIGRAHV